METAEKQNVERYAGVLMKIIRSEICEETPDISEVLMLSEEEQMNLAKLAKRHSVEQLLGDALGRNPASAGLPVTQKLFKSTLIALNQVTKNEKTRKEICRFLEELEIPYIPLKGARIRKYYPQPWMRTSCDIDILVPEEYVEQAARLLTERLGYHLALHNYHDISLYSPEKVHLELHFSILENQKPMDCVLGRVWEYSKPVSENGFEYAQSNEFFMFHLMAHIVHHVLTGGCGIRPFLDLFVLKDRIHYDEKQVEQFCAEAGILTFWQNAWKLVDVWFGKEIHTDITRRMEHYILTGGTFGTAQNLAAVGKKRHGGKIGYLWSHIWIPTSVLAVRYPILKTKPWLAPVCQMRRWLRVINPDESQRVGKQLQMIQENPDLEADVEQMLRENGFIV